MAVAEHGAEAAFRRSIAYRHLSSCFLHPNEELCRFLNDGDFADGIRRAAAHTSGKSIYGVLGDIGSHPFEAERMREEYVRLFTLRSGCPPYENEYHRSWLAPFTTEQMADVAGFYRAFGMGISGERPDHIGAELEYMHLAAWKEAEAASGGMRREADLCRSIQTKFLQDHLGRWTDAFANAVESEGSKHYMPLARLLREWVDIECEYMKVKPEKLQKPFIDDLDALEPETRTCPGGSCDE